MRPVSPDTLNNIISLLNQGLSTREIAKKCKVSSSTVQKFRKIHCPNVEIKKGGRPKKLTLQDKRFCVRALTSGKAKTATEVTNKLKESMGVSVSVKTVTRALNQAGLASGEKKTKPLLSRKNIKARLEFARAHKYWTVEDWKCIIWSDETKINRFQSDGRSWYWKREGNQLQHHHVKQTVKHGGGSIMIWGCMTAEGPGNMCKIDGTMDQYLYKTILEDDLLKTIDFYQLDAQKVIFQHDNDPKHKAKSVKEWLETQDFQVLEWPAQSPDLNPIENLWSNLKRRLSQYESPPKGILELWERIEVEWGKIEKDTCLKLIESMPKRMKSVIKAKGMWIDY
jgi:transposase